MLSAIDHDRRRTANHAQRLWLLERSARQSVRDDARAFVGAITVLDHGGVRLIFVRSSAAHGASEASLLNPFLRLHLDRDARSFASLDDAIRCADATRRTWLRDGWNEATADANDH